MTHTDKLSKVLDLEVTHTDNLDLEVTQTDKFNFEVTHTDNFGNLK